MSTILATAFMLCGIQAPVADRLVEVDTNGVIRWRDEHGDVAMFGVNYYAPFAADHEGLTLLGEDHRKVIDREVSRVLWQSRTMTVQLPDLGSSFSASRVVPAPVGAVVARDGTISVEPGVYTLTRKGRQAPLDVDTEFWAPRCEYDQPAVWWRKQIQFRRKQLRDCSG